MTKKIFILVLCIVSLWSVASASAELTEEAVLPVGTQTVMGESSPPVRNNNSLSNGKVNTLPLDTIESAVNKIIVTDLKSDNVMIEIKSSSRIKDYTIITLAGPSRLVVEIRNAESRLGEKIQINKLGIKEAILENNPNSLKITLEALQGRIIPIPYRVQESDASLNVVVTAP